MTEIPSDFWLGAATAAYQIEGAVTEDGRGPSIWDVFSHTVGRTHNGDAGDVACDHYHRFAEDIVMMKELGLDAYRFSIAWPRLFPEGTGEINQAGFDFYQCLVESLLEADIQPVATLYHWDLPQALQEQGGWTERDTAERFADYAEAVFRRLGSLIPRFITVNEPWCSTVLGHLTGEHAPGVRDAAAAIAASHHLLLAHGRAVEAFRAENLNASQIGITNVLTKVRPVSSRAEDQDAATRVNDVMNGWFLDPLFRATYPLTLQAMGMSAVVRPGDLACISQPIDFLGVNYYRSTIVEANTSDPLLGASLSEPGEARTGMGWGIDAEGLYNVLVELKRDYPATPIYITENGAAYPDQVENGQVHDRDRAMYIRQHLEQALRARADGVDVRGYFVWSLLDNFEWAFGFDKRFGIVHVDFETQHRTWKDSAKWYQQVLTQRTL